MKNSSFICPVCGALLQAGARVCRDCGSDDKTGWSEATYMDGIDLPLDNDEYEEIREKEFADGRTAGEKNAFRVDWKMIVGIIVIAAFIMAFVLR